MATGKSFRLMAANSLTMTLLSFLDIAELKIHGNTGCNYFNGEIYIYPNKANAIDFSKMGVTRMACPKTAQETAMLVALEQTQTVVKSDKGHAILLDSTGKEVMKLKKSSLLAPNNIHK